MFSFYYTSFYKKSKDIFLKRGVFKSQKNKSVIG